MTFDCVYSCNGNVNQQFDVQSNGSIKSRTVGGMCIDIPNLGRSPRNGDKLQMWQCSGNSNQRFNVR